MCNSSSIRFIFFVQLLLGAASFASFWRTALASDANVILDIISSVQNFQDISPDWSAANISNYCLWQGIECDEVGRIYILNLVPLPGKSLIGSLPQSIATLDELREFSVRDLVGDLPAAVWSAPHLKYIIAGSTGLNIKFPQNFSPELFSLDIVGTNVSAPFPENLPYNNLTKIGLARTGIRCPLPQSAINVFQTTVNDCSIKENPLFVQDGKLCGQVPLENIKCSTMPLLQAPTVFTDPAVQPPAIIHTVKKNGFHFEITEDRIMLFAVRKKTGLPYRDQYLTLNQVGWTVETEETSQFQTWPVGSFKNNLVWVSDNEFRVNATVLGGVFELEWRFIFNSTDTIYGASLLKFTVACYNLQDYAYPSNSSKILFTIPLTFRAPHSSVSGSSIKCTKSRKLCVSNEAMLENNYVYGFETGKSSGVYNTSEVRIAFQYATVGSIDGEPMTWINTRTDVDNIYHPIGVDVYLDCYSRWDPNFSFPGGPLDQQFSTSFLHIGVPLFHKSVIYDPDVSITLLFDPDDAELQQGLTVGAIAAIVIVVVIVVLAVSISAIKFWIWPRLAHEAEVPMQNQPILEETDSPQSQRDSKSQRWHSATVPQQSK